jgi:hypothetical protein
MTKQFVERSIGLNDEQDVSLGLDEEIFDPEDDDIGKRGARVGEEIRIPGGWMTDQEALARASSEYRMSAQKKYKMELSVIGDARVGAKNLIGLWGDVSETFSGLYYVKEALSIIQGGSFTQRLSCERDAQQNVSAAKKKSPKKRTNQVGKEQAVWYLTTITLPSGENVPGYMWSDDGGKTPIATRQMTEEEFDGLSEYNKEQLRYNAGGVSYPDN